MNWKNDLQGKTNYIASNLKVTFTQQSTYNFDRLYTKKIIFVITRTDILDILNFTTYMDAAAIS